MTPKEYETASEFDDFVDRIADARKDERRKVWLEAAHACELAAFAANGADDHNGFRVATQLAQAFRAKAEEFPTPGLTLREISRENAAKKGMGLP